MGSFKLSQQETGTPQPWEDFTDKLQVNARTSLVGVERYYTNTYHFLLILLFRGNLWLQWFMRCCFKEVVILKEAGRG